MDKDHRYNTIKPLIDAGHIKTFEDIFNYIPRTMVAKDLGMNAQRFTEFIKKVENFRIKDLYHLARLSNVDPREIAGLIFNQYEINKSKAGK